MNLVQLLTATKRSQPDKELFICANRRKTAADVVTRVSALGNAFMAEYQVQPGHVVAISAHNSDMYLEVVLAVLAIGGVIAPLNWRWSLQANHAYGAHIAVKTTTNIRA